MGRVVFGSLVCAERLSDIEHGLWCPTCLLPSASAADFAFTIDGHPQSYFRMWLCHKCRAEVLS